MDMRPAQKKRIAIIGGGCAGMAAAFELTRPELAGRYEVTVYQLGWRLGGKGASGRDASGRIEEHGLHLWMGFYENAFRLMRECYAEAQRDPARCPIATWEQAFIPDRLSGIADYSPSGRWRPWLVTFPPLAGLPGDPQVETREWNVRSYLARAMALLSTVLTTLGTGGTQPGAALDPASVLRVGSLASLGAALEAVNVFKAASSTLSESSLGSALDTLERALRGQLEGLCTHNDELRRLWEIVDLCLALTRGVLRFRLLTDPAGFDAIDAYDCREWLRMNGASERAINSGFIRALYDLGFSYEQGDPRRPRIAASQAVRGAVRAFFTYRGAFFYKLAAGMGDVVFAPMYEVLRRRGVRFEFFHRLCALRAARGAEHERPLVSALEFDVQARPLSAAGYEPLIDFHGLPCWPNAPRFELLCDGSRLAAEGRDFESHWDRRSVGRKVLLADRDFDCAVLAVGVGAVAHVAGELAQHSRRWRDAIEHASSVATQALQLWLGQDMAALGWKHGPVNLSGFVEPFDTWADMTHLLPAERAPERVRSLAYFCSVLPDAQIPYASCADPTSRAREVVHANARLFLEHDLAALWPGAVDAQGRFRWELLEPALAAGAAHEPAGPQRLRGQYARANINPSDRYALCLPGSLRHRLSPLDHDFDNLTVAGDWTNSGFNGGCVEAAVMSGRLAAHAIAAFPPLEDIVGYDHP